MPNSQRLHSQPNFPVSELRYDPAAEACLLLLMLVQAFTGGCGIDVGTGTPSELLREAELTQTLLLLYCQSFNGIHSVFGQTMYLRRFVLALSLRRYCLALGLGYSVRRRRL
ncbi:hypothetical protein BDV10DRAFT_107605 [Aspergillus recurvatus]